MFEKSTSQHVVPMGPFARALPHRLSLLAVVVLAGVVCMPSLGMAQDKAAAPAGKA